MLEFNANLRMLFNEVDFPQRFQRAAKAVFKGVEFLFSYEFEKGKVGWLKRWTDTVSRWCCTICPRVTGPLESAGSPAYRKE